MSIIPDQLPDDETSLARNQNKAEAEKAQFRVPAEIGVVARTFDKYTELSHPASVGEEERIRTIEDVSAKMRTGGVASPELLFADIALSLLPDNLVTPGVADARDRLKQNPSRGLMNMAILIEQSADAQPNNIIFRNPIQSDKSTIENVVHTNTKARAAVFSAILEQETSVFAIAREFNQSQTVEGFGKGIGPAIISAYEGACRIVEDNPDPYILAGVLTTVQHQLRNEGLKQVIQEEQKRGATKYKFTGITMPSNITSKDIK